MDKKIIIATLVASAAFAAWIFFLSPSNKWACENGQWVKHGHPLGGKPGIACAVGNAESATVDNSNAEQWGKIKDVIANCGVVSVSQKHDLTVEVFLKNRLKMTAKEPEMDEVIDLVKAAKEKCGDVPIATE